MIIPVAASVNYMGSHISSRRSAPGADATRQVQAVLDAIRRIVRVLRESSRATEKLLGISGAQLFVLQALSRARRLSVNEVAARTFTHQSSVSVVIQRLVEQRLVQRNPSPKDARSIELSLSGKGRRLVRRSQPPVQQRMISALMRLPARRRRELERGLGQLIHQMEILGGAPRMFFEDDERSSTRKRRAR